MAQTKLNGIGAGVEILLTTLNARFQHASFGLRYLRANLGSLRDSSVLVEFTIAQSPREIAEQILEQKPRIVGIGVYIWNATAVTELVSILKKVSPKTIVVLGGPEVTYEPELQPMCQQADYVVRGEGEFLFRDLCEAILLRNERPKTRWISGPLPEIEKLVFPYSEYTDEDIRNRVIYIEASRGCPYKCEYCLSSLDKKVRAFPLDAFLAEMQCLLDRGVKQFKFVDRTFNLSITTSKRILEFFLERLGDGLFLHFEMVPDRLPPELLELIRQFPPGCLQFEVGIQTWNPEVAARVSRRQNYAQVEQNLRTLRDETGVHVHVDLIAGLPGETLESFAAGFDRLAALRPQEIQLGILKRLRGAPIDRHTQSLGMVYQESAPYTILRSDAMDFATLQKLNRMARFWDRIANSGRFVQTTELLRQLAHARRDRSIFWLFWELTEALSARHLEGHSIALSRLAESLRDCLPGPDMDEALAKDEASYRPPRGARAQRSDSVIPDRQRRHLEGVNSPLGNRS